MIIRFRRRSRYRNLSTLAIIGCLSILFGVFIATSNNAARSVALRAHDFVESVGVATHLWVDSGQGEYGKNPDAVLDKIANLGMRFYRGYYANSFKTHGLKGIAWVDTRQNDKLDIAGITASLARYRGYEDELIAIELPNEYDSTRHPRKWQHLQDYIRAIADEIKTQPALQGLPVLGPAMASPFNTYSQLKSVKSKIDIANIHPYSGNLPPESYWDDIKVNGRYLDIWKLEATQVSREPQIWATEVGWDQVNEQVQAKYSLRTYAWFFKQGIARTMLFQLIDGDGADWGLLRSDLSEKPAYQAIKNLMTILADGDSTFSPGSLNYKLDGDQTEIATLLLQKGNGNFELLLWQTRSCWDRQKRVELNPSDRPLTLRLPKPMQVNLYRPLQSPEPTRLPAMQSVAIAVPDHLLIVEISADG